MLSYFPRLSINNRPQIIVSFTSLSPVEDFVLARYLLPVASSNQRKNREAKTRKLCVNNFLTADLIPKISWVTVLWMTLLMGGAAGIGSLPFFFVGSLSKEWAALANALACGVMLACSFDLVHEGQPYGGGSVIIGILLGEAESVYC